MVSLRETERQLTTAQHRITVEWAENPTEAPDSAEEGKSLGGVGRQERVRSEKGS